MKDNILEAIEREINRVSEPQHSSAVEDLLYDFTSTLKPIDFSVLKTAGKIVFIEDEQHPVGGKPVTGNESVVLTALAISTLAEQHRLFIRSISDTLHVFTGTHYEPIDGATLRKWLISCADKIGAPYLSIHHPRNIGYYIQAFSDYCTALSEWTGQVSKRAINVENGIITFDEKGKASLNPHTHELPYRYSLPYRYDEKAKAPIFDRFLTEVLPDEQARTLLQTYIGSMFTATPPQQVAFLLGSGANGKSVFLDVITALLNPANITNYSITTLCDEERGKDARKGIEGKLLNVCTEVGREIEGATFKKLATGEPITGNRKYHDNTTITDYARLLFACNELPRTNDVTEGFFRRFAIIEFGVTIPAERQDPLLASKIKQNLSGVLNWVIDGVRLFVEKGYKLTEYQRGETLVTDYRRESDSVLSFLFDKDIKAGGWEVKYSDIYETYRGYAVGYGYKPVGKPTFTKRIEKAGIKPYRGRDNIMFVRLNTTLL